MSDIKYEPPVGSQVTDCEGDIWDRREGGWTLWWPEGPEWLADLDGGGLEPWSVVRWCVPLRFTTDEDRKRVGLHRHPAPDVDPDEALAEAEGRIADLECRAKKAESELADMTRQRDALGRMADHNHDVAAKVKAERDGWKARHAALRADVDRYFNYIGLTRVKGRLESILTRDTERGAS